MNIKLLSEKAKKPTKGSKYAAGYDLYSTVDYQLKPLERYAFKTDVCFSIPTDQYGRIAPRSGNALKAGIEVLGGVIDPDYTGEVKVILVNLGQEPFDVKVGDKVAQIIFEHWYAHEFLVVDDLAITERGNSGFGSTDMSDKTIKIPEAVKSALTEMYVKKHSEEVNPKVKYSEIMKEREKNI